MFAQIALAVAVPGVFVAHALWLGIEKAGAPPWSRTFWDS